MTHDKIRLGIVTAFPPSPVTLNEYAYHLVKHLSNQPKVGEIILYTDVNPEDVAVSMNDFGCPIRVERCWKFNGLKNVLTVRAAIKRTAPDGVLFNLQFMKFGDRKVPAALGLFMPWMVKLMNIPSVVLLHNIMETVDLSSAGFTSNKILTRMYTMIGTTLTKVLLKADTVALTIKQYVETLQGKYRANNVTLIPHGTFETISKPEGEISRMPYKIMTFGKFGTYKKVDTLLKAFELLRKKTQLPLELVIAGTDNPNTPGYLSQVRQRYSYIPNVSFTGYVAEEDVPDLFTESCMVIFPYTSTTGSSGVLHQAGSYAKAVVMPNIGDLNRLITDEGYQGVFFDPENVMGLCDAMEKLLLDEELRSEIGKANHKAANAFPMSRIAERYLEEFELLNSKGELVAA